MNIWNGIGNLGSDPKHRETPSGKHIVNFNIAVDRLVTRTGSDGSTRRVKETDWIPVVCWGVLATSCNNHLQTGSKVAVSGRLQQRRWVDRDNKVRISFEIVASQVQFLSKIKGRVTAVVEDPHTAPL